MLLLALTETAASSYSLSSMLKLTHNAELLSNVKAVAVPPDDQGVYIASHNNQSIIHWQRNTTDGSLSKPRSLVLQDGVLRGVEHLAFSADGRYLYAAAALSEKIVYWKRNVRDGSLSNKQSLNLTDVDDNGAPIGLKPFRILLSDDGRTLFAACYAASSRVMVYNRNTSDGSLYGGWRVYTDTANKINDVLLVGDHLYVLRPDWPHLFSFTRDNVTGRAEPTSMQERWTTTFHYNPQFLAASPKGDYLYLAMPPDTFSSIRWLYKPKLVVLRRDQTTGALTESSKATPEGQPTVLAAGEHNVYLGAYLQGLLGWQRDPAAGGLSTFHRRTEDVTVLTMVVTNDQKSWYGVSPDYKGLLVWQCVNESDTEGTGTIADDLSKGLGALAEHGRGTIIFMCVCLLVGVGVYIAKSSQHKKNKVNDLYGLREAAQAPNDADPAAVLSLWEAIVRARTRNAQRMPAAAESSASRPSVLPNVPGSSDVSRVGSPGVASSVGIPGGVASPALSSTALLRSPGVEAAVGAAAVGREFRAMFPPSYPGSPLVMSARAGQADEEVAEEGGDREAAREREEEAARARADDMVAAAEWNRRATGQRPPPSYLTSFFH